MGVDSFCRFFLLVYLFSTFLLQRRYQLEGASSGRMPKQTRSGSDEVDKGTDAPVTRASAAKKPRSNAGRYQVAQVKKYAAALVYGDLPKKHPARSAEEVCRLANTVGDTMVAKYEVKLRKMGNSRLNK